MIKIFSRIVVVVTLLMMVSLHAHAQSVELLRKAYSGKTEWNPSSGRFTFRSSGVIDFKREKEMSGIWTVPENVSVISISAATRVSGQFTFHANCTMVGEDQKTSIIHGTDIPGLLHKKKLDKGGGCIPYSAVLGHGKITLHIQNLTTLNPIGYMWTGKSGAKLHLEGVRGIDDRGGWHNHSDGISAAAGSTVRNCHIETGDDAIKLYRDILVENTTIVMIQNCVPIQLGWGSYGDKAKGVFNNLTIIGKKGRGKPPAVIVGRKGTYQKTIEIDGLSINNPNAALVSLYESGMKLDLTATGANISVKQFWGQKSGLCRSRINNLATKVNTYHADDRAESGPRE